MTQKSAALSSQDFRSATPKLSQKLGHSSPKSQLLYYPWLPFAVGLFAAILYAQTVRHSYNMDDIFVLESATKVENWHDFLSLFSKSYFDIQASPSFGYRPLVIASFALEYVLFGNQPFTSHVINVLLYGIICGWLYVLLLQLFGRSNPVLALFAVLLFATHPLHTEVVASIKNRDELLAFLGFVGCFLLLLRYTQQGYWQGLVLGAVFAALALLSKKSALGPLAMLPLGLLVGGKCFPSRRYLLVCLVMSLLLPFFSPLEMRKNLLLLMGCATLWAVGYLVWGSSPTKLKRPQPIIVSLLTLLFVFGLLYPEQPIILLLVALLSLIMGKVWPRYLLTYDLLLLTTVIAAGYLYWSEILLLSASSYALLRLHKEYTSLRYSHELSIYLYLSVLLLSTGLLLHSTSYSLVSITQASLLLSVASSFRWKTARWVLSGLCLYLLPTAYIYNGSLSLLFVVGWVAYLWISVLCQKKLQRVAAFLLFVGLGIGLITNNPEGRYRKSWQVSTSQSSTSLLLTQQAGRSLHPLENPLASSHSSLKRAVAVLYTYGRYLQLHLFPYPLRVYYGYEEWTGGRINSLELWVWVVLYGVIIGVAWWLRTCLPLCSFALIFYMGCLFPFSNALVLVAGGIGERFTFASVLGFSIVIAYAVVSLTRYYGVKAIVGCVLLLLYSTASCTRASYWKDKETLYLHDVSTTPRSAKLHQLLADLYLLKARSSSVSSSYYLQEAEKYMKHSLSIAEAPYMHWYSMGLILQLRGKATEASTAYKKTLHLSSNHSSALFNLAACQTASGKLEEAASNYKLYLERYPKNEAAYANLAFLYFKQGTYDKALEIALQAAHQLPQKTSSWLNLGRVYLARKDTTAAISSFQHAQKLSPKDKQLHYHLQKLQLSVDTKK